MIVDMYFILTSIIFMMAEGQKILSIFLHKMKILDKIKSSYLILAAEERTVLIKVSVPFILHFTDSDHAGIIWIVQCLATHDKPLTVDEPF